MYLVCAGGGGETERSPERRGEAGGSSPAGGRIAARRPGSPPVWDRIASGCRDSPGHGLPGNQVGSMKEKRTLVATLLALVVLGCVGSMPKASATTGRVEVPFDFYHNSIVVQGISAIDEPMVPEYT